jgi:hypothetical protein
VLSSHAVVAHAVHCASGQHRHRVRHINTGILYCGGEGVLLPMHHFTYHMYLHAVVQCNCLCSRDYVLRVGDVVGREGASTAIDRPPSPLHPRADRPAPDVDFSALAEHEPLCGKSLGVSLRIVINCASFRC